VGTLDNFGRLGEKPTHPELLDWLAATFRAEGGSLKSMIRRLVLTDAFARSSKAPGDAAVKDPENRLLSHWSVRRMEAEAVRDSMLALSGSLDQTLYGEPVPGSSARRSIYVQVIRNRLDPLLTTFDAPVPAATRGKRDSTNVPAQSLALLNDPAVQQWAKAWAMRSSGLPEARAGAMIREATGRSATEDELRAALAYLESNRAEVDELKAQNQRTLAAQKALESELEDLLAPARLTLDVQHGQTAQPASDLPRPFAEWDFQKNAQDLAGALHLHLEGGARLQDGALVLDGNQSLARSDPLPRPLKAKTMEAWVQLADLRQGGGGVMTVQDRRGNVFNAIVYGEKFAGQWLAGSDHHSRTQSLEGKVEQEAQDRPVHIAMVWAEDGTITAYRDGVRYGSSYKADHAAEFGKGDAEVLLGCRHGSATGGRLLRGKILRARLYDRALTGAELARTRWVEPQRAGVDDLVKSLSAAGQEQARELLARQARLAKELSLNEERMKPLLEADTAWASLALALFNLKEFVYLR